MNARLQPAPDVLARLPASDAPWTLTFEPWPQAEAQRWRAVMARSARGRLALLADRPPGALAAAAGGIPVAAAGAVVAL